MRARQLREEGHSLREIGLLYEGDMSENGGAWSGTALVEMTAGAEGLRVGPAALDLPVAAPCHLVLFIPSARLLVATAPLHPNSNPQSASVAERRCWGPLPIALADHPIPT